MKHELCHENDLQPGEMRAADVDRVSVVVIRKLDGSYRVLRNRCAHFGAPLSKGLLQERVYGDEVGQRELAPDLVLRCPWHGYEFDVDTGVCPADPKNVRVKSYPVVIEDGMVTIER